MIPGPDLCLSKTFVTNVCIVGLNQDLIIYKNIPLCWSGACTRALENQKDIKPTFTHGGGVRVGGGDSGYG